MLGLFSAFILFIDLTYNVILIHDGHILPSYCLINLIKTMQYT